MAKSVLEQLKGLLSAEDWQRVQTQLDANPTLAAQDAKTTEIFSIYLGEDDVSDRGTGTGTGTGTGAGTGAGEGKPATPPAAPPAAAFASDANVLSELQKLNSNIDAKFEQFKKDFIPMSRVNEFRTEILSSAIKSADDYASVRETHRAEFGEPLDRGLFEKFVTEQRTAGVQYKDMKSAHDAFVSERRVEKKIADGITAGTTQRKSGTEVPGQTQAIALSPAQQVIAKAKQTSGSGDKSNAMAAADRLAKLRQAREEGGAGAGTVQ